MPVTVIPALSRRALLTKGSLLGAAAIGIAGLASPAFAQQDASKDIDTLNTMLTREHQEVAAYQIGADSGLLKQTGLNIALLFQSHHRMHRDALIAAIQKIGGSPVPALSTPDYAKQFDANNALKSQNDVLAMALKLELDTANTFIGILPVFVDRELAKLAGRIIADETMHWTALASTLAQPLPANALSFGG